MNDTERQNLPSASSIPRLAACPGSFNLSKGIAEFQTPEMKAWAEAGERIHLRLEDPTFITLDDPQEMEVANACLLQKEQLIEKIFGDNWKLVKKIKENRLWLTQGRKRIFSGKPDDISVYGDTALVIDFKTSRGDQETSPKNLQLRSLAVLLDWNISEKRTDKDLENHTGFLRKIFVAIIQPLVNREPLICCYETEDIQRAKIELLALLTEINKPDAPRSVNEFCKFCPALTICPEASKCLDEIIEQSS